MSHHVIFFFHLLRRIQASFSNLTGKVRQIGWTIERYNHRYSLIGVDNAHWFACFIRNTTVTTVYKHRGHLKITVIVSAVLHSLIRHTLLVTANASSIISNWGFVQPLRQSMGCFDCVLFENCPVSTQLEHPFVVVLKFLCC